MIGASSTVTEDIYQYGSAFYDYFQIDELKGLTEAETRNLLLHLSRLGDSCRTSSELLNQDPARIRTLHVLTGGNPRTVVLLYNVLALGVDGDVRSDLQRFLDQCTPLYKARFEGLANQAQQIMDALAIHWDPISAGELAGKVRLDTNIVSSQLNRLVNDGLVEKVEYYPGSKTGFQIAERFFNIWYLMRASRRVRTKLVWLVEFLRSFFAQEELTRRTRRQLDADSGTDPEEKLKHAEFSLALARVIDDTPLRGALESTAIRSLVCDAELRARRLPSLLDLEGDDASLEHPRRQSPVHGGNPPQIFTATIPWEGWSAEKVLAVLVFGSPSFTLNQKAAIARDLEVLTRDHVIKLTENIEAFFVKIYSLLCDKRTADNLFDAIRQGYMIARKRGTTDRVTLHHGATGEDIEPTQHVDDAMQDVEGARIAAEALICCSRPPRMALAFRLDRGTDEQTLKDLKDELPQSHSPYPWYRWASAAASYRRLDEVQWACATAAQLGRRTATHGPN